jgi:membrane-bound lytic murein transglycosylase A
VLPALRRSCVRIVRLPPQQLVGPEGATRPAASWQAVCREAELLADNDDAATRAFFERRFVPYAASNNGDADGLFTGYYEPELRGARTRGGNFTVPLYGRPMDMINVDLGLFREEWRGRSVTGRVDGTTLKPYHDRAAIEGGAIAGKAPELVWVDDKVDAFFLQVQGSGRVTLDDGSVLRVGYAAQNGHPYVAIGRELIQRGELARENVSMQSIRAWLRDHPDQAESVMNANPSFVFFRTLEGDGPLGAEGVALTAGRSLAVDRSFVPYGTPLWLDAEDPLDANLRVRRLMVAQDTGGAIKGPVRGDVFWGYGAEAAERAGKMKSPGRYWLLVPRAESATN